MFVPPLPGATASLRMSPGSMPWSSHSTTDWLEGLRGKKRTYCQASHRKESKCVNGTLVTHVSKNKLWDDGQYQGFLLSKDA